MKVENRAQRMSRLLLWVSRVTICEYQGGAENAGVENAGVENAGAITYG